MGNAPTVYPPYHAQLATARLWLLAVHDTRAPLPAVAAHFDIEPAIALAWIAQTQKNGLLPQLPLVGHWPRPARWSQEPKHAWTACGTCRRPWPCTDASTVTWLERLESNDRANR